jgi:choline dehydrogenase-like flavoprotein
VLERGRDVQHIKDYTTAFLRPWELPNHEQFSQKDLEENPVQCTSYNEGSKQFYVSDKDHPYIQENPFYWIRGYQVGGRSLTWGRQCYRLSDLDFEANAREGIAVDWPIRYSDIAPWYDYVEEFVGVSGSRDGLPHLPDGPYLPPMEMNCIEEHLAKKTKEHYTDRIVTIARVANLSQGWKGRGPCQYRNLCDRGCPFSGYFSSNAATLPAAALTGNMTLVTGAIVTEVIYDEKEHKATGIRVIDYHTGKSAEYFAPVIFLNASTVATAAILLNSKTRSFPNGLGNSSGQLGHNLMDHFVGPSAQGNFEGMEDQYYSGRRPAGIYVPRFRNLDPGHPRKDFLRGYGLQGLGMRLDWGDLRHTAPGFGKDFKKQLLQPGPWSVWLGAWAETLPYHENRISLDKEQKDRWGQPIVRIAFDYRSNEHNMAKDVLESTQEMLHLAGFRNIRTYDRLRVPGSAIHEMGTARMGRDPKTSVLNGNNQLHDSPNVFVTDGSCMTSSGSQNPSLTYMALTARACDYAVSKLKKGEL